MFASSEPIQLTRLDIVLMQHIILKQQFNMFCSSKKLDYYFANFVSKVH